MNDTIPVSRLVLQALRSSGVPLDAVLARLGIDAENPPASFSTESFFAFWRGVEGASPRRDIGLVIGAESPRRGFSVSSAAALNAPTLAEALETVARYKRLTCPETVSLEVARGEATVNFHWVLAKTEVPRLLVDAGFASFAGIARIGSGGKALPVRVELARKARDAALYREHFGCRIVFGASVDRIVFEEAALALPFVTADAEAFSRVVPGLEAELRDRSRGGSLREDVRVAIARNLGSGSRPSVDVVARRLHLSPRTLQRRLGEERTTYQEELDDVRRTSARRLLAHTEIAPSDIAFLLGFDEPNSFARAFRAWERTTPVRWREKTGKTQRFARIAG
jgi:AraC-like DNA-binding protein